MLFGSLREWRRPFFLQQKDSSNLESYKHSDLMAVDLTHLYEISKEIWNIQYRWNSENSRKSNTCRGAVKHTAKKHKGWRTGTCTSCLWRGVASWSNWESWVGAGERASRRGVRGVECRVRKSKRGWIQREDIARQTEWKARFAASYCVRKLPVILEIILKYIPVHIL